MEFHVEDIEVNKFERLFNRNISNWDHLIFNGFESLSNIRIIFIILGVKSSKDINYSNNKEITSY